MKKSPEQLKQELAAANESCGKQIHERTMLAIKLLADTAWIETDFDGDKAKAIKALESDCFGEIQAVTLSQLLEIGRAFPDESQWRAKKWNLKQLWADCIARDVFEKVD